MSKPPQLSKLFHLRNPVSRVPYHNLDRKVHRKLRQAFRRLVKILDSRLFEITSLVSVYAT